MHRNSRFSMFLNGVLLTAFLLAPPAIASKEGGLSLYSVVLDSPGMAESGPVHVEVKRTDAGLKKLVISAFGKTQTATSDLLESIKVKRWIHGVQLSFTGSGSTGGKAVHVLLTQGGSWGVVVVAVIAFDENGKFTVLENLSPEEAEQKAAKIVE